MKTSGKNQYKEVTIEDIIKKAKNFNLTFKDVYKNSKTKMLFEDEFGYKYSSSYQMLNKKPYLLQGNKYAIENINNYLKINNINLTLLSDNYINQDTKMDWLCECKNIFSATWSKVKNRNKHQCNVCGDKLCRKNRKIDFKHVNNEVEKMGYKIKGEYIDTEKFITLVDTFGYKYYTTFHHLKLNKPMKFYINNPYTIENINLYIKLNKINCILLEKEWKGNDCNMKFKCSCGNIFCTTWATFTNQKQLCDICSKAISSLELKTEDFFKKNCVEYKKEYCFDDLFFMSKLRFDFAIFNNNKLCYLVECQGKQHYICVEYFGGEEAFKKQLIKDEIKRDYCIKNNIPLLELKYTLFEKGNKEYIGKLNLFDLAHRI